MKSSIIALQLLLLASIPQQTIEKRQKTNRILRAISQSTLPIYLFHEILLETLQKGYLGFSINGATINPIIEIPLETALTLLVCLVIIVPLKKVPYLKSVLG